MNKYTVTTLDQTGERRTVEAAKAVIEDGHLTLRDGANAVVAAFAPGKWKYVERLESKP